MLIYEVSLLKEGLMIFIYMLVFGMVAISATISAFVFKKIKRILSVVVLVFSIFAVKESISSFLLLAYYIDLASIENLKTIEGKLQNAYFQTRTDMHIGHNTPILIESILIDKQVLTRPNPRTRASAIGCHSALLTDELKAYIGKGIRISYIDEYYDDLKVFSPCILKVEVY